ncbi:TonB-dependent receptor [Flavihumibacter petaseus]|uniref:Putative TonB-dependent receptor n=1 Tax=Flavihumibacter petaseus NBRC 106054 TaxID=1220578 RepID=A0A0E9MZA4_9BACT|nr:TonB-dependent receptor [Flavihumibacter petaseus]GAO43072.1 putative TonB-dependent receptor [Flavihumibacter petaseus NBRC 106054]
MKFTAILLLTACLQVSARGYAQRITLSEKNANLEKVFREIRRQSGYNFVYTRQLVENARKVTIHVENATLESALDACFRGQPITYTLFDSTIVIKPRSAEPAPVPAALPPVAVKGTVMDEDGKPLVGVSISRKGQPALGVTDEFGNFSLMAEEGDVLVFSMVGMADQEVKVVNSKPLKLTLQQKNNKLNDIVVVGYAKQKKISVTGAVSTVNMTDMRTPVASLSNALAGKVAGVISMQSAGGEPGYDNPTFTIRGVGTFAGSVSPLIIVDGVQRDDVNSTYGGAFNNIDPEDIASISLLKDASATAVYGARGANGVLIITTKRGIAGKPRISAKAETGVTGLTKLPKMLDGVTYMQLYNEAQRNDPSYTGEGAYSDEVIAKTKSGLDPYLYPDVDWINTVYKDWASMTNANVNVSGGGEAMRYYLSMSFYNQDGQYKVKNLDGYNPNLNFKRYDFRSNIDVNLTKSTVLSLNIGAMLVNSRYPGNPASSIWYSAFATNPISFPVKYEDDKWAGPRNNGGSNPFNLVQNAGYSTEFNPSVQSVLSLNQKLNAITKGLSATARFSFDSYGTFSTGRKGLNDLWYAGSRNPDGSLVYEKVRTGSTYLDYSTSSTGERVMYLEGNIAYDRTFGDHSFGGLLVANMRNRVIGTAPNLKSAIPFRNQNYAGRITYGFRDKYLLEVNAGATGSENFAPGHRWGFFPAVSAGWVISREKFFEPLTDKINLLKVRASRGVTGNDQIGGDRFGYLTYIDGSTGVSLGLGPTYYPGISESVLGTEDLRWEKSTKDNLGLEVGLFNKLNIVVDVFRDNRTDILIPRSSISPVAGYSNLTIYANMGEMVNKGIDGSIEYNDHWGKDFGIRLFGNVTYAKNTILFADEPKRTYAYQQREGHSFGEFTGYNSLGLFIDQHDVNGSPAQFRPVYPGDIKYADLSGDNVVNGNDWTYLGKSSFPKWSYGFGGSFSYKGFELSLLFTGVADVGIMANGSAITTNSGAANGVGVVPFAGIGQYPGNVLTNATSRWTADNPSQDVDYPRLTIANTSDNNYLNSTWWLKDGSFCRLKQASVAYNFNSAALRRIGMTGLQVYASGINLFTASPFKLWDPELGSNGAKYPYSKTVTVGFRVQF